MVAAKVDRNEEILERVLGGEKYEVLANEFGVTVARIGQVVSREAKRNGAYRKALREVRSA